MRLAVAIATAALLLLGVAAPHHHAAPVGGHECVACAVGGSLAAEDATPALSPPVLVAIAAAGQPGDDPVTGAPLGAVPGQSPPFA